MKLANINTREQLLIGLVMIVMVLGSYSLFRFIPEQKSIASLAKKADKTERKLLRNRLPDEPTEDLDDLIEQLNDQEQAIALIRTSAESMQNRLASFDSQELKVRISQLATANKVRIKTNEVLRTQPQSAAQLAKKKKKKKKKKVTAAIPASNVILPASSSWIARMSPNTLFYRPMQRLELEGSYQSLRQFIHGLEGLPWQVTVIRLRLDQLPTSVPAGYPQPLSAELVLAL